MAQPFYKQEEVKLSWYGVLMYTLGLVFRHRARAALVGEGNLPTKGPFILVLGPHKTEVESTIVAAWLRKWRLCFYAKAEYWRGTGPKGWLARRLMIAVEHIPVERRDPDAAKTAIEAGAARLRCGKQLAVFPEGTRSPANDNTVHAARAGTVYTLLCAMHSAYQATGIMPNIPIIPVGLIDMEEASSPNGGFWPRKSRPTIAIGTPIRLDESQMELLKTLKTLEKRDYVAVAPIIRALSLKMMQEIARLSGRDYNPKLLPVPGDN